jgi:hypothetical protein
VIVERRRGADAVAGKRGKLADLAVPRSPRDSSELEHLWRDTRRIVHRVLGPADGLAQIVGAGSEAVSAAERPQWRHNSVLPAETEAPVAGARGSGEEEAATPPLVLRVRLGALGDPGDNAPDVLHRPQHRAVGAAESSQVGERAAAPQRGVPALVARQVGAACHPAAVVHAVAHARCAAQRLEVCDLVRDVSAAWLSPNLASERGAGEQRGHQHGQRDQVLHEGLLSGEATTPRYAACRAVLLAISGRHPSDQRCGSNPCRGGSRRADHRTICLLRANRCSGHTEQRDGGPPLTEIVFFLPTGLDSGSSPSARTCRPPRRR